MWLRNLLFLGLVGGGVTALAVNLIPSREPSPLTSYDGAHHRPSDLQAVVEQVDTSFRQQWIKNSQKPAAIAPDLAVARRLSLGLMGTVPSLEEIRQFERLPSNERLSWWVDHILEDRRYADYFAERLARACVGTEDGPFIFYRRRRLVAWLGDQLAANQSYDRLVHDLIAGEGLWTDKPATNFVTVTSQQDHSNQPDPVRLAGRVTRAFLGLRLDCAQCHNHPFADWKQADFQALSAFFGQTQLGFTGIHDGMGEYEVEDLKTKITHTVQPRVPFAQDLLPENGNRRQKLAEWITSPKNPFFARATVNRVWALMAGRPLVEPVDNLESDMPAPPALKIVADDFASHGFDLRRLIRVIAATEVFHLDSIADHESSDEEEKAWAVFPMTRLRPEQVIGSLSQACSLSTIDAQSPLVVRLIRYGQQNDFVKRYGDSGEDEFDSKGGTIPQRLLMMNGALITDKIKDSPLNATSRIAFLAPNDARAVESAYLAVLTRRPTPEEAAHFETFLAADSPLGRNQRLEDLYWALLNSTEFSWNH
jgi:hypothetical protein